MTRNLQLVFATLIVLAIATFMPFWPLLALWVLFLIYEYRAVINFSTIPFAIAMLILAAHFLRMGSILVAGLTALIPSLLLIKQAWVITLLRAITWFSTAFWVIYSGILVLDRIAQEGNWIRLSIIMLAVIILTFWSGMLLGSLRGEYTPESEADATSNSTDTT